MFFILSKLLYFLINPLSWITAGLIFTVFTKAKRQKVSLIATLIALLLFTNPLLINGILKKWEYPPTLPHELPLVRTGIVLGGVTYVNKSPGHQLHLNENAERLVESTRLLREQVIQELIVSGGSGSLMHQDEKEGDQLKTYLQAVGLGSSIVVENKSRNTHENAIEVSKILEEKNVKDRPLLLITSAFHMRRAARCFEKQGIKAIPYPVDYLAADLDWSPFWLLPNIEALENWRKLIKEWAGFLAYRVVGYA